MKIIFFFQSFPRWMLQGLPLNVYGCTEWTFSGKECRIKKEKVEAMTVDVKEIVILDLVVQKLQVCNELTLDQIWLLILDFPLQLVCKRLHFRQVSLCVLQVPMWTRIFYSTLQWTEVLWSFCLHLERNAFCGNISESQSEYALSPWASLFSF